MPDPAYFERDGTADTFLQNRNMGNSADRDILRDASCFFISVMGRNPCLLGRKSVRNRRFFQYPTGCPAGGGKKCPGAAAAPWKKEGLHQGESIGICMLLGGRRESKSAEILPENL